MKPFFALAAAMIVSGPALAEGDPAAGEKEFRKCRACHEIVDNDGNAIVRGGKVGPNLYGIPGAQAGAVEGFNYGDSIVEAGAQGLTWDVESFSAYIQDPRGFLAEYLGGSAQAKMAAQRVQNPEDLYAYLESVSN